MYSSRIPTIKHWGEEERPRERFLIDKGENLSNAELIAILIGSGNCDESAVGLAHRILQSVDDDLARLAELSVKDLSRFKGIGLAKAVTVSAAIELCFKRMNNPSLTKFRGGNSMDAYQMIRNEIGLPSENESWIFLFSSAGILKHKHQLIDPQNDFGDHKSILQTAITYESSSIMLVKHSTAPGLKDSTLEHSKMLELVTSANMISIVIIDRITTYTDGYHSYRDNGLLSHRMN